MAIPLPVARPKDPTDDREVRWCPGCGNYSILTQIRRALSATDTPREKIAFVSGYGCSSRLPHYMNAWGFQTLPGRAPAVATGLKLARPDVQVWVVTGDGDALSAGGNHLIHALRRNADIKVLMFDNEVSALTRGHHSPTSRSGAKTPTSRVGSVETPVQPLALALACEATFVARTIDVDIAHLVGVLQAAAAHRGSAFVQIYQNCNVFNDGAFGYTTDKTTKSDHVVYLEHGEPLTFGRNGDRGIRLNGLQPEVVEWSEDEKPTDLLIHDAHAPTSTLAYAIARMSRTNGLPEPLGIFRAVRKKTHDELVHAQGQDAVARKGKGSLAGLFRGEDSWAVD